MREKYIEGFDNKYVINENGEVFSLKGKRKKLTGKISNDGYLVYTISHNNKKTYHFSHVFVANAFIENPLNKPIVNHKDGNKLNNHVDNLEWSTHSENQIHAVDTGLVIRKLNLEIAEQIRNDEGTIRSLAIKYGVGRTTINKIKLKKIWYRIVN